MPVIRAASDLGIVGTPARPRESNPGIERFAQSPERMFCFCTQEAKAVSEKKRENMGKFPPTLQTLYIVFENRYFYIL